MQLVSKGYLGVLIQVCRYDFIQAQTSIPLALVNPLPLVQFFSLHLRKTDKGFVLKSQQTSI